MNTKIFKVAIAVAMFVLCIKSSAQTEFIEKYEDDKTASYVYVSKVMLNMIGGNQYFMHDLNTMKMGQKLAGKLNSIQIISTENADTSAKLRADVSDAVKNHNFEIIMKANDEGEKVTIYFLEGKKDSNILMLTTEDKETNLIAFAGDFTAAELTDFVAKASK